MYSLETSKEILNMSVVSDVRVVTGQDTGPAVVIKENSLLPCRRYRVMVRMTSTSGLNAAAVKEFLTNCPPWGGNCSVVPTQGG